MAAPVTLALSGDQHEHLKSYLFPGDGKEAVALLLCGRRAGDRKHRLVVREIHGIPYCDCAVRTPTQVTWPPDYITPMLDRAADEGFSSLRFTAIRPDTVRFPRLTMRGMPGCFR
jgi:hypothetical protein